MEFRDIGDAWNAFWKRKWYWLGIGFLASVPAQVYFGFWGVVPGFNLRTPSADVFASYFAYSLGGQIIYLLLSSVILRAALTTWRTEALPQSLFSRLPARNIVLMAIAVATFDLLEFGLPKLLAGHSTIVQLAFLVSRILCIVPLALVVPFVVDQHIPPLSAVGKSARAMLPYAGRSLLVTGAFTCTLIVAASPFLAVMITTVPRGSAFVSPAEALLVGASRCLLSTIVMPVSQLFTSRVFIRLSGRTG